jgi:multidrug efflux pump subunit AcrA (membrane-fusion protein)
MRAKRIDIAARVSGRLLKIAVVWGQNVEAGTTLIRRLITGQSTRSSAQGGRLDPRAQQRELALHPPEGLPHSP